MTERKGLAHCSTTVIGLVALAAVLLSPQTAVADQVCGCKKISTGKVKKLVSPGPPTCSSSYTPVCWNDDQSPAASGARAHVSAASVSLVPPAKIEFDTENYDRSGEFSAGTFTPTSAGYYLVAVGVTVEDLACERYVFQIRLNGVNHTSFKYIPLTTPNNNHQATVTDVLALNANDQIEVWLASAENTGGPCSSGLILGGSTVAGLPGTGMRSFYVSCT